jgi:hypothetical protein
MGSAGAQFDYYAEGHSALDGADVLARLRSVIEMARDKGEPALPENESTQGERVINLGRRTSATVRDGAF